MNFFKNIFGKYKKEIIKEDSPYLAPQKDPKEIEFAKKFTEKGGKFIFSENRKDTLKYFRQILA